MAVHLRALEKTQLLEPDEVEDQTCPVCYEDYVQTPSKEFPRKLPCGHLIGTECLLLWASSQTHAASIDCPWCMHPIIHSTDMRYIQTAIPANAEAALEQPPALIERVITVVYRGLIEHRERFLSLAVALASPNLYFDRGFAMLPLTAVLFVFGEAAMRRRLKGYPRHGMLWIALGLNLGTFFDQRLGLCLVRCGKAPFNAALKGIYSSNTRLVLGVTNEARYSSEE